MPNPTDFAPVAVFDLDGTLADTGPDLLAALNHAVSGSGFALLTGKEVGHLVGQGAVAMISRAYELNDRPLPDDVLQATFDRFLEHYEQNIAVHSRLFPSALPLLDQLADAGYALAICTNKPEKLARLLLEALGIAGRFAAICGGDTFGFRKPDGRHITETVRMASGGAAKAVMIGDTITDLTAARDAGVPALLVDFGYSDTPVTALAPDAVISCFKDAFDIIVRRQKAAAENA